jgi:glycosyltransferase involved in cell wall biosynthesis
MEELAIQGSVSVIVPTIGRAASLQRMLESLCRQSIKPDEVIIADGSSGIETETLVR